MRKAVLGFVALVVVALTATVAMAANPHLKGKNPVAFTDNGLTLTATVSYAGLGNFDTLQTLSATGQPTATCTNPAGATQPPGQNPAAVTLTGSTAVPAGDIKNGNVTITTTTGAPVTPIPGAPGLPQPEVDGEHHRCGLHLGHDHAVPGRERKRHVRCRRARADRELHVQPANVERVGAEVGLHLHDRLATRSTQRPKRCAGRLGRRTVSTWQRLGRRRERLP